MKKYLLMALVPLGLLLGAAGLYTNGIVQVAPGTNYSRLLPTSLVAVDTNLSGGRSPQTVASPVWHIAALGAAVSSNQATATAGAATLARRSGMITSEALTTAPGATYTLTLTNSAIVAGTTVMAEEYDGTNTANTTTAVTSVTVTPGQVVIVVANTGAAALNGTIVIPFHLTN